MSILEQLQTIVLNLIDRLSKLGFVQERLVYSVAIVV